MRHDLNAAQPSVALRTPGPTTNRKPLPKRPGLGTTPPTLQLETRSVAPGHSAPRSWGDAALQSLPVVHYANGVTINEPDELRVLLLTVPGYRLHSRCGWSYFPGADTSLVP